MKEPTRIHLVRHGQVAGYENPRYNGQSDVPLTESGLRQYHELKERLAGFEISACYTSDLSRCAAGAEIISGQFGIEPVRVSALREINIGLWEGLSWSEISGRWPDEWNARLADIVNYRPPGGENLMDVRERVIPVISDILQRHNGESVLVVGHGGVNRIILLTAIGAPMEKMFNIEQSYGCHNIIDYHDDGRATVKLMNSAGNF